MGFLVLLVAASFIFGGFFESSWVYYSVFFYLWLFVYVMTLRSGVRLNIRALRRSKSMVFVLGLSALWVFTQLILPLENPLVSSLGFIESQNGKPWAWFEPEIGWSSSPERGFRLAMSEVFYLVLLIATISIVDSRDRVRHFLYALSVIGLVHALIGLVALYGGIHLIEIKEIDGHWGAARGLFVNRNHFASLVVLCMVGSLSQLLYSSRDAQRQETKSFAKSILSFNTLLALVCLSVGLVALIESQSRGALLGLIVGIFAFLRFRANTLIVTSIVLALLMLAIFVGSELIDRLSNGFLSLGERGDQWLVTLKAIFKSPFFGYGGGSYATVFQIFRENNEFRDVVYSQSHNLYLHIWLERGLVGLLLWLTVLIVGFKKLNSAIKKSRSLFVSSSLQASGIVLTAALFQSVVDYNLQVHNIRYLFFSILGFVFAAPFVHQSTRKNTISI